MSKHSELVERLEVIREFGCPEGSDDERDLREAIAAIREMEAALEPFALIADTIDEVGRMHEDDDRVMVVQAAGCELAQLDEEHFRRARLALGREG